MKKKLLTFLILTSCENNAENYWSLYTTESQHVNSKTVFKDRHSDQTYIQSQLPHTTKQVQENNNIDFLRISLANKDLFHLEEKLTFYGVLEIARTRLIAYDSIDIHGDLRIGFDTRSVHPWSLGREDYLCPTSVYVSRNLRCKDRVDLTKTILQVDGKFSFEALYICDSHLQLNYFKTHNTTLDVFGDVIISGKNIQFHSSTIILSERGALFRSDCQCFPNKTRLVIHGPCSIDGEIRYEMIYKDGETTFPIVMFDHSFDLSNLIIKFYTQFDQPYQKGKWILMYSKKGFKGKFKNIIGLPFKARIVYGKNFIYLKR
jgi:hypothetical protein